MKIMATTLCLTTLMNRAFQYVNKTTEIYKIDESHGLKHSMEVFGYHPDLKKWTEIGNSGIFRPEMLIPLGLPPDVRVIAWGLSLERPTMIKYRCKNIRELFGHKVQLDMIRKSPICRF